jgi:hypothetical protein
LAVEVLLKQQPFNKMRGDSTAIFRTSQRPELREAVVVAVHIAVARMIKQRHVQML